MTPQHLASLTAEIARAHDLGTSGHVSLAVKSFDLAREMVLAWTDPETLSAVIAHEKAGLARERDRYRKINFDHAAGEGRTPLLILGDSLGLPRPDRMKGIYRGAEKTYPWMLGYDVHGYQPTSLCQRYFTTADGLAMVEQNQAIVQSGAAIVHLGLNDCANRMFLEPERLALSLLSEELRNAFVEFARVHRKAILKFLPGRHYVSRDMFRRNLDVLIAKLHQNGYHKIALTTIILPPSRSWAGTPGMAENFGAYNAEIMAATTRNDVCLFDLDRLVSEKGNDTLLIDDGMHLSDAGHTLFTREVVKLLKS